MLLWGVTTPADDLESARYKPEEAVLVVAPNVCWCGEMVDTLGSNSSALGREGSTPSISI